MQLGIYGFGPVLCFLQQILRSTALGRIDLFHLGAGYSEVSIEQSACVARADF